MAVSYQPKVRPEKVEAVARIKERLERAGAVLLTEYRGLTVGELASLRSSLAEAGAEYRVVKNTLAYRAARELGLDVPRELFEGPTALAYCFGDPVRAAKALAAFARDHPALEVKGGLLDGRPLSAEEARELATVDPLDASLAKVAGSLTAPVASIVGILQAPLQRIAYVLERMGEVRGA